VLSSWIRSRDHNDVRSICEVSMYLIFKFFSGSKCRELAIMGFLDCAFVRKLQESEFTMLTCRWYLSCGAAHPASMLAACASAGLGWLWQRYKGVVGRRCGADALGPAVTAFADRF